MKRINILTVSIATLLSLVSTLTLQAQQTQLAQQWYSRVNRNPSAVASGREDLNMAVFYHNQWTGMEGAPQTLLFNGDLFFKNLNSGFGLSVAYDKEGVSYNKFNATLAYGYHLNLNDEWKLSFGLAGGIMQFSHDPRQNTFSDPTAPGVQMLEKTSTLTPDFNAGVETYFRGLTLGFAIDHLLYNNAGTTESPKMPREYYAYGRYVFALNSDFDLAPQAGWGYAVNSNLYNVGATVTYKKFCWFGADWRINTAMAFMAGIEFHGARLGYAYQASMGNTVNLASSTHEIMLQYSIKSWRK